MNVFASTSLVALLASAGQALVVAGGLALAPVQSAHAWWTCPTDKPNFEARSSNGSHVRCSSETQYRSLDECPNATASGVTIGTGIKRDYSGNHDKCVGYINNQPVVVLDPTCNGGGTGYAIQRRTQPDHDRCRRLGTEGAPTRNVN